MRAEKKHRRKEEKKIEKGENEQMKKIAILLLAFIAISLFISVDLMMPTVNARHISSVTCRVEEVVVEGKVSHYRYIYNVTCTKAWLPWGWIEQVNIDCTWGASQFSQQSTPFKKEWTLQRPAPNKLRFQCPRELRLGEHRQIDENESALFTILSPFPPEMFDYTTVDGDNDTHTGRVEAPDTYRPVQRSNLTGIYIPCDTYTYTASYVKGEIYAIFLYLEPEVHIQEVNVTDPAWKWYINNTAPEVMTLVLYTDTNPVSETTPEISFSLSSPNSLPGKIAAASCGGCERLIGPVFPERANLHPGWAHVDSDLAVLNEIHDRLIVPRDVELGNSLSWVASNWTVEPYDCNPLDIHGGTKITFQLRSGVTWHDGQPVTAGDVKFAWEFLENFPKYKGISEQLAFVEVNDPCTVTAYMNISIEEWRKGMFEWVLWDLSDTALLFPKHIYDNDYAIEQGYDPTTAPIWEISYEEWTGNPQPEDYPFMKALIGCGSLVLEGDKTCHLVKFKDYWIDNPAKQNFIVPSQRVEPVSPGFMDGELEFYVELVNLGDIEVGPITIDYVDILIDGEHAFTILLLEPIVLDPLTTRRFGPFHHILPAGPHTLECHTCQGETIIDSYQFPIYVTLREDINYDFKVNIIDIAMAAKAFGSIPRDLGWDSSADINDDFKVNIIDIAAIARKFGWP